MGRASLGCSKTLASLPHSGPVHILLTGTSAPEQTQPSAYLNASIPSACAKASWSAHTWQQKASPPDAARSFLPWAPPAPRQSRTWHSKPFPQLEHPCHTGTKSKLSILKQLITPSHPSRMQRKWGCRAPPLPPSHATTSSSTPPKRRWPQAVVVMLSPHACTVAWWSWWQIWSPLVSRALAWTGS